MDTYQKEIMDQVDMNILAIGDVLADAIADLKKTTVFDDMFDAKQERLDKLTQDYEKLLKHKREYEFQMAKMERDYEIQMMKIRLEETDPRRHGQVKERFFEKDSVIRAGGDIAKGLLIGTMSFAQLYLLWKLEKDGYIFSRNLSKIQLPRP